MMRIRSIFTKMGISVLNKQNLTLQKKLFAPYLRCLRENRKIFCLEGNIKKYQIISIIFHKLWSNLLGMPGNRIKRQELRK